MHRPLLLFALTLFLACTSCNESAKPDPPQTPAAPVAKQPGQELHDMYCGTCHALPHPTDLDKKTWSGSILVRMSAYMGIYNDNQQYFDKVPEKWLEPGNGGQRVMQAGIYPEKPLLSRQEWEQLRDYIVRNAPDHTFGPAGRLPIQEGLPGFKARIIQPDEVLQPLVTAVSIDEQNQQLYAAFFQQELLQMDARGKVLNRHEGLYGPVHMRVEPDRISISEIGSIKGSDNPVGQFISVRSIADLKRGRSKMKLEQLQRPVFSEWADLDGDGDEDLVLCEFGYHMGALVWQENLGNEQWERHVLFPDDGSVSVGVHDFNGDNLPDILALMANSDESIRLYTNQGGGKFSEKRLFRFNPTFGGSALELVDFDKDGDMDFIVANGDNGDYVPILKPNHGIRLYRNQGNGAFEEAFFLGMNGAYGTRTRDYDQDGDLDIAAVSFYPDYAQGAREAFVYFEQTSNGQFAAHTVKEAGLGRWMILDAGDLDGDGDTDIVLGSFNVKSSDAAEATYEKWMSDNVPLLVLENQHSQTTP